jgi:hypothetical protein
MNPGLFFSWNHCSVSACGAKCDSANAAESDSHTHEWQICRGWSRSGCRHSAHTTGYWTAVGTLKIVQGMGKYIESLSIKGTTHSRFIRAKSLRSSDIRVKSIAAGRWVDDATKNIIDT